MLTFLRILTEALETEKDRINKRKLSGEEIGLYESILNYDFTDTDVNSSIVINTDDGDLGIKWDLTRHGKHGQMKTLNSCLTCVIRVNRY